MSDFDYDAADHALQAQLRGEPVPSPLDVYGRDHSMACIISAANEAMWKLDKYASASRKLSAVWDVPKNVDRKIAAALRAVEALRELAREEQSKVDNDGANPCQCKGCVR
jgi:hypothetical protein